MVCKNPFLREGLAHGCGQCLPCRINRRRLWTHRIILESYCHDANSFLTLTYSDENLPPDGGLYPPDVTKFIKRLREKIKPQKFRYYLVGEYGENTSRPHYHIALFGYAPCAYGRPENSGSRDCKCPACVAIRDTWALGHTHLGELNPDSASYIAQYVTKAMTKTSDVRLDGRHPEFARMSNRPGIGALAIPNIANAMKSEFAQNDLIVNGDVPETLLHGRSKMPLGRYLKNQLRKALNREEVTPDHILQNVKAELLAEKEAYYASFKSAPRPLQTMANFLYHRDKQRIINAETKFKLFKKGQML